jgi:hypothetical protein
MPVLAVGKPISSDAPTLLVENKLAAGTYTFSLVVETASGLASAPAMLKVVVRSLVVVKPPVGTVLNKPVLENPIIKTLRTPT